MSNVKIKREEYGKIVELYSQGLSHSKIANIYNCGANTIGNILKRMNVSSRPGGSKITKSDIINMQKMYENGKILREIAEEYNTTYSTVSKLLKNNGVVIDRYTYHFNEHYFDDIDSEEKAYIIGLLWADGHNCMDRGSIIIELQEQDKDLLEKINVLTENERPLREQKLSNKNSKWQNQYRLVWQSRHLSSLLNTYGMCQRKSLVLEFPQWLDKTLYSAFIRGYVDGDGCISLSYDGKFASFNMVGTKMFLTSVATIFKEELNIDVNITRDSRARDPICTLRCGKKTDVVKLLNWLYKDAHIFLQRKFDKYNIFINNSCCA